MLNPTHIVTISTQLHIDIADDKERSRFNLRYEDGDFGSYLATVTYDQVKKAMVDRKTDDFGALLYCVKEAMRLNSPPGPR
jgi:hypothetical protein